MQDEVIQRFEDRCTEANAEIQQLREAMQETSKRLEAAENRLASTMESRNKLRRQLDAKQAEMTTAHASLQADNEVLKVCSAAHVQAICLPVLKTAGCRRHTLPWPPASEHQSQLNWMLS